MTSLQGLPDCLPFSLAIEEQTNLVQQKTNIETLDALNKAYKIGSTISGAMDNHGIGKTYAGDFFGYVNKNLGTSLKGKKILEIGCGTGYFLSLLQNEGACVLGIEPGPQGQEGGESFGVSVIKDFFPSEKVKGEFDVIVAYAVFEHIRNQFLFLDDVKRHLTETGIFILAVPDCEPYLSNGDVSCFIHEHWSYFTSATITTTLAIKGFKGVCSPAGFGGSIYGCFSQGAIDLTSVKEPNNLPSLITKSEIVKTKIRELVVSSIHGKKTLGIYVPGRMINILSIIMHDVSFTSTNIRFFDDDSQISGKFYPGFEIPIETFDDLINSPVDQLIIASNSFGKLIGEKVQKYMPGIEILYWDELYNFNV